MNNGMMMLIAALGLLWFMSQKPATAKAAPWVGGSQAAQQTAAYEIGF